MHYYQFHVGDYAGHAAHLDEMEDLAYRRMLDYCYLNEIGLPESVEEISRLIRMRTHTESIANVLREFFYKDENGDWRNKRAESELNKYKAKSAKASESARKRWDNTDANALQTQTEGNANQEPRTKNQEPVNTPVAPKGAKITLSTYLKQRSEQGLKAIEPDHAVFKYAEKVGIPEEFLYLAWRKYSAYYADGTGKAKKYTDWPMAFANSVKNNYAKLWWVTDAGEYQLTTAGKQAQLEFANE